jgi:hypothetical protein
MKKVFFFQILSSMNNRSKNLDLEDDKLNY